MSDQFPAASDGWLRVCALDEVPVGELKSVEAGGERIVLANVEGDVYALEDQCSHQEYPLSAGELDGDQLECVFHGARLDVNSGRATRLPAVRPVRTFQVRTEDGGVYLRLA